MCGVCSDTEVGQAGADGWWQLVYGRSSFITSEEHRLYKVGCLKLDQLETGCG